MIEILRTGSAPSVSIPTIAWPPSWYAVRRRSVGRHHDLALRAEHDPLERVGEVGLAAPVSCSRRAASSAASLTRFARSAPTMPGVVAAMRAEVDVVRERHVARVHAEDRLAAVAVGRLDGDAPVEAARAQQRLVEHVGPVRRRDHDHAGRRVEAVHLGEDLVQRLLALVVAAAEAGDARRARAADRVELVDEDDRRRRLLRLLEQVAHARRADADDRLDELRGGRSRRTARSPRRRRRARAASCRCPAAPRAARRAGCARRAGGTSPGRAGSRRPPRAPAFASSMPATSANVTRSPPGS